MRLHNIRMHASGTRIVLLSSLQRRKAQKSVVPGNVDMRPLRALPTRGRRLKLMCTSAALSAQLTVARSCWSAYLGSMFKRKWASTDSSNRTEAVSFICLRASSGWYSALRSRSFCTSRNRLERVCKANWHCEASTVSTWVVTWQEMDYLLVGHQC